MAEQQEKLEIPKALQAGIEEFARTLMEGASRAPRERREFYADLAEQQSVYGRRGPMHRFMHPAAARRLPLSRARKWTRFGKRQFAQPDLAQIRVDPLLTEMSIAYGAGEFIAREVFPEIQSDEPSGIYFVFDRPAWRRDEGTDLVRGPSARAARVEWTVSQETFRMIRRTVETTYDDIQERYADDAINLDRSGAELVGSKLDLRKEKEAADLVRTAANWTNSLTLAGTDRWDDPGSDVMDDFRVARLAVRQLIGRAPNTLVIGVEAFEALALNGSLLERIKYTGTADRPAAVTGAMMAALFGVERLLIGAAVENTAAETIPDTETNSWIWGKDAFLSYRPDRAARETPSSGYIFTSGRRADRYREENITSEVIRAEEEWAAKKTGADAGYLWKTVIS